jgi:crotonobetainyl-CoA:carnitine CoA-transferase CaiB-like acyl-CoA transferase
MSGSTTRLRVVELGHSVRTGYCGLLLGHLGAQVTKVVGPEDDRSAAPVDDVRARRRAAEAAYLNRFKEVVSGEPAGVARLLGEADVVLAPGADAFEQFADQTPAAACERDPALIVGIASLLGERGRYADYRGHEVQALALGGLLSMVGQPGREPLRIGGPQAEHSAALALLTGVSVKLFHRSTSGRGGLVSTSAVRATAYVDWKSQAHYADDGTVLQRGSTSGPIVLRCSDGFLGFYYRDEEWDAVKRLVGDERLDEARFATQRLRDRHRDDLVEIIEGFSRAHTRAEACSRSQALGIPAGSVLSLDELLDDRQLRSGDLLHRAEVPGLGTIVEPAAPWVVDGERQAMA